MNEQIFPTTHETIVEDAWVDYNGHMNLAYYVLVFDRGTDGFLEGIGMTADHRDRTGSSAFVAETHVSYLAEVMAGERLRVTTRVIDYDAKRLHLYHAMTRADDGIPVAETELMILHVDLNGRRVCPFPGDVTARLAGVADKQMAHPRPESIGRKIGIRRSA